AGASESVYADRRRPTTPGTVGEPEPIERPPPRGAAAEPAKEATGAPRDERSILAELHRLGEGSPDLSLQLAREGNERFPGSADAPERSWFIVKSLVNMQRFDE